MYARRLLLAILFFGMLGTAAELLLLEHFEDVWQLVPLVLIGVALPVVGWHAARPASINVLAVRCMMVLFALSGLLGLFLHYRGNVEFEMEMYPGLEGWQLLWQTITGATPALAPGTMILLGAIGFVVTITTPSTHHQSESR